MEETGFGKRVVAEIEDKAVGGTILDIEKGKKTDMAFYLSTEKIVYVLTGKIMVWVMRDGQLANLVLGPNTSFYVKPGLIHQFEGIERSAIIEFVSDIKSYRSDLNIVAKGTQPEQKPVEEGEFVKMTPEDEAALEETPKKKVTRKKKTPRKTTKKRTTKKK